MIRRLRILSALGAIAVLPLIVAACGGVPGDSVATVAGDSITKARFEHWLNVAAHAQGATGGKVVVPDPPDFQRCVANKRKTAPAPAKGQPKPTTQQFLKQCRQEYDALRDQTMNFLIQAAWVQGEASDQGIKVTDKQVRRRFEQTKKQNFPTDKAFKSFLKQSGMTRDDVLFQVRVNLLSEKLRSKVTKGTTKVTDAQIAAYYAKHKSQFATPARRDIQLVLAKNKANAQAALNALRNGASWKDVVKKYSTDPQTKNTGGLLRQATKADQDPAFGKAAFSAPKGKLEGPVKSQFGWYVFRVQKVYPAKQQALKSVESSIRSQLIVQRQQKALNDFIKKYRSKWTDKTECRKGFVIQGCKGAPKQKATSTTQG